VVQIDRWFRVLHCLHHRHLEAGSSTKITFRFPSSKYVIYNFRSTLKQHVIVNISVIIVNPRNNHQVFSVLKLISCLFQRSSFCHPVIECGREWTWNYWYISLHFFSTHILIHDSSLVFRFHVCYFSLHCAIIFRYLILYTCILLLSFRDNQSFTIRKSQFATSDAVTVKTTAWHRIRWGWRQYVPRNVGFNLRRWRQ
jgi:hypothetical protein